MDHKYDDIIHLPHPVSSHHVRMSMIDRGAQFSPFAALTGYDAAIRETARLTESRIELDETHKAMLNEKILILFQHVKEHPEVAITYFVADEFKSGGAYVCAAGQVKKIDSYYRVATLTDETRIPFEDIVQIDSGLFRDRD